MEKCEMKNLYIILLCFVALLMSACGKQYTRNASILEAESLMDEHPDSAYKLLNNISHPEQLSEKDYAAWCLHFSYAQYKLYKDIKSDSLIQIAVDYYADSKLKKYGGISYYLLGCISELLHEKEKAMMAYKNALVELEGINEYNISGLTTFNMGYIYRQDKNFYLANSCYKQSLHYFNLSGNKNFQFYSCVELTDMYQRLDYPFDSVMFYSKKTLKLSREIGDSLLSYRIISRQGELYNTIDRRKAIDNLLIGFHHLPDLQIRNASFLAYLYSQENMSDSATYYLKIANKEKMDNELEILKDFASGMVSEVNNNFRQAFYSFKEAYSKQDTIFQEKLKSQLYTIDKQFDLSEKENENAKLKIANRNKVIWIALLMILVLMAVVVLLLINAYYRKKQTENKIKQQKMEFDLKEKELENKTKYDLLLSKLSHKLDVTIHFKKIKLDATNPQKKEEFIEELTNQIILVESEWQYYINETNSLFNNKIALLQKKHTQLTSSDMIVIALICMGINIMDSCILLNSSKETMYTRRKRIKKRLGIDAEVDLEEWIKRSIL